MIRPGWDDEPISPVSRVRNICEAAGVHHQRLYLGSTALPKTAGVPIHRDDEPVRPHAHPLRHTVAALDTGTVRRTDRAGNAGSGTCCPDWR